MYPSITTTSLTASSRTIVSTVERKAPLGLGIGKSLVKVAISLVHKSECLLDDLLD
jgi:hypothetical protein